MECFLEGELSDLLGPRLGRYSDAAGILSRLLSDPLFAGVTARLY
jgi:hypothetical protein